MSITLVLITAVAKALDHVVPSRWLLLVVAGLVLVTALSKRALAKARSKPRLRVDAEPEQEQDQDEDDESQDEELSGSDHAAPEQRARR